MRKFIAIFGIVTLFLAACSGGGNLSLQVANTPSYEAEGDSEITLAINQDDEAVTGATVSGTLEMARMDHGVIQADFSDNGDGTYTTMVDLPMGGEWIMVTEVDYDGNKHDETITFNVTE